MSDLRPKSTKFDFGWSSATDPVGGDGGLLPLPKNHCRSRPFGPRPRCSQAFFFPNLGMSQSLFTDLLLKLILVRYLPHSMFTFYRLQGYLYEPMLFQPCFALSHCHFIYTSVHLSWGVSVVGHYTGRTPLKYVVCFYFYSIRDLSYRMFHSYFYFLGDGVCLI